MHAHAQSASCSPALQAQSLAHPESSLRPSAPFFVPLRRRKPWQNAKSPLTVILKSRDFQVDRRCPRIEPRLLLPAIDPVMLKRRRQAENRRILCVGRNDRRGVLVVVRLVQ